MGGDLPPYQVHHLLHVSNKVHTISHCKWDSQGLLMR